MTTIVYILISSDNDLYYEQALLSIYSLRLYHPNEKVVVLVDKETDATLQGRRAKIRDYASEVKAVDVPENYTPKERSRYLKTTFRRHLAGDLIFIDTDTIVAGEVMDMAKTDADVACVLDYHVPIAESAYANQHVTRIQGLFGRDVRGEKNYYNSGVMFVRDTPAARALFEKWHEYWKVAAFTKGQCFDQPPLLMADLDCGHVIREMDGVYNCQILTSVQYLHHARIIHFFNGKWDGKESFSPFFKEDLYREIKALGDVPEKTARLVRDCKSSFHSPSFYMCPGLLKFHDTFVGSSVYSLYKRNSPGYKALEVFLRIYFFLVKLYRKVVPA